MRNVAVAGWKLLAGSLDGVVGAVYRDTTYRIRRRGKSALLRAARISGASVASWVVAHSLSPNTIPILAPLTAVLVVQVTLTSTLKSGIERVVSVVAGVLLAVVFSAVVGLTWWSLGLLVAVSIIIGQLLKLGPNLVEVPISAMLVLAVGGAAAGEVATGRIYETIVGALVGTAANVVFPPALRTLDAGGRVQHFAVRIAAVLETAAATLGSTPTLGTPIAAAAQKWLDESRRLTRHVPAIDKEITDADEARQLNLRALGTPRTSFSVRDGLEALEHSLVGVRGIFRSIADGMPDPGPGDEYTPKVRAVFGLLLDDLARCIRSFGTLVKAQVQNDARAEAEALSAELTRLRRDRAQSTEVLLLGARSDPERWEPNVTLLATIDRILLELDVEEYVRDRQRYLAAQDAHLTHQAAERLRERSRRLSEQLTEQLNEQLKDPHLPDIGRRLP